MTSRYRLALAATLTTIALAAPAATPSIERLAISTPMSDVRLAVSPDGRHRLWGVVDRTPGSGLEIVESWLVAGQWTPPVPVPFNGDANDFDPAFAPDGRSVWFFSNRAGGSGGDDLYQVAFDPRTRLWGTPRNLGPIVNTPGNEWAPSLSPDGRNLLFSSNRPGGSGKQDLYLAPLHGDRIGTPMRLGPAIETGEDEFDATFAGDARHIIFTRGDADGEAGTKLHLATLRAGTWHDAGALPAGINCSAGLNIGPSVSRAGRFYWSAACGPGDTRLDLWSADLASVLAGMPGDQRRTNAR
ncbi:MAG: hypothetical protein WC729_05415 [Sphingomonas sp.]|jgi:Tol biopolymer transport system component|uniref:TolB family protein n=1 Tax=Sphingomonas sp. TaxID=28214 RepID=UPI003561AA44